MAVRRLLSNIWPVGSGDPTPPDRDDRRTFRVKHLPHHMQIHHAQRFLRDLLSYDDDAGKLDVLSLASDVESHENPPSKVATVQFSTTPQVLESGKVEWNFERVGLLRDIIIDTHFLGFTVLNDVDRDEHVQESVYTQDTGGLILKRAQSVCDFWSRKPSFWFLESPPIEFHVGS